MLTPVGRSVVDWDAFLQAAQTCRPSASLDRNGVPAAGDAPFVAAVSELARAGSDPLAAIRGDRLSMRHLHFSFIIELPKGEFFHMQALGLAVTARGDLALVSGTLRDWVDAVVQLLTSKSSFELRRLVCAVLLWFEMEGLGEAWGYYGKRQLLDGTFVLEDKRCE